MTWLIACWVLKASRASALAVMPGLVAILARAPADAKVSCVLASRGSEKATQRADVSHSR